MPLTTAPIRLVTRLLACLAVRLLACCAAGACLLWAATASAAPLDLATAPTRALGLEATWLMESAPLKLEDAMAAHAAGKFSPGTNPVLGFGLDSRPVWVHLALNNASLRNAPRRLLIENSWVDELDIYFVQNGRVVAQYALGDSLPFTERPLRNRFFIVPYTFTTGTTDIYLRAATPDPTLLPIYVVTADEAARREQVQGYSYGFIYGYLIALAAYNAILFLSLRYRRHLSYAFFLAMFITVNFSYTGHGFAWLWPDAVMLQRWIIPVLMVLYSIAGLVFARYFLDTPRHLPRTHRAVTWLAGATLALLALAVTLAADQFWALVVAFATVGLFSLGMPVLGILAFRAGVQNSRYFIIATAASAVGTALTALCVLDVITFAGWKFRAAEVGMLIDATLLALALGSQFRLIKTGQLEAEERAARDPLTGLRNRRSFLEIAQARWSTSQRNGGNLTLIMLDLDHFKAINDQHGHAAGDAALVAAARVLESLVRDGDLLARWGGEEFLLLLPETGLEPAVALAERLRLAIAGLRVRVGITDLSMTASFGVAARSQHENLDRLISEADGYLYEAKQNGRNRVRAPPPSAPK